MILEKSLKQIPMEKKIKLNDQIELLERSKEFDELIITYMNKLSKNFKNHSHK